jgi:hypothetical protein
MRWKRRRVARRSVTWSSVVPSEVQTASVEEAAPRTPPFQVVSQVLAALRRHGAEAAIGGSGLLAALGLVDQVRDWDVTTEIDHQRPESGRP